MSVISTAFRSSSAASTERRISPKTSTSQLASKPAWKASKPAWKRLNVSPPNERDVPFALTSSRAYDPDARTCGQKKDAAI